MRVEEVLMKKKFLLPRSARGQSLVEMAISLVLILWLLSGAAEFAVALFQYIQLRDAAQEGALYGSIKPTNFADIETRARTASASPIDLSVGPPDGVTIQIYVDNVLVRQNGVNTGAVVSACESHALKVIASYNHHVFMPFMPQILNITTIPLEAEVIDTILTPIC